MSVRALRVVPEHGPISTLEPRVECEHGDMVLDTTAERVYCRDCGAELSAYRALARFTEEFETYLVHRDEALRQWQVAEANLAEIEREIFNARCRLRRAARKAS